VKCAASIRSKTVKSGYFVISGRNTGEIESEFDTNLKKQSQFRAAQMSVTSILTKDYINTRFSGVAEKKASQSQPPAFGRKSEILSPKSETDRMEAERQIPARFTECDLKKQSQLASY
jgi:hypothetical protein